MPAINTHIRKTDSTNIIVHVVIYLTIQIRLARHLCHYLLIYLLYYYYCSASYYFSICECKCTRLGWSRLDKVYGNGQTTNININSDCEGTRALKVNANTTADLSAPFRHSVTCIHTKPNQVGKRA